MFNSFVDKPASFIVELKDTKCSENEPVSFVAELNRKVPLESVKWTHDGKEIPLTSKDYAISVDGNNCLLKIFNPSLDNSGQYSISVHGATSTASLNVERM